MCVGVGLGGGGGEVSRKKGKGRGVKLASLEVFFQLPLGCEARWQWNKKGQRLIEMHSGDF